MVYTKLKIIGLVSLIACFLYACSPTITSGSGSTTNTKTPSKVVFDEDLSAYRPKYGAANQTSTSQGNTTNTTEKKKAENAPPPVPAPTDAPMHVNRKLDMILDTMATRNRSIKYANGFRIQIYMGTDRKQADDAKLYVYNSFPELNPYLQFSAPKYQIRVGDFMSRLDAERYHTQMKDIFPNALIVSEKIDLRKSMLVK
jgi:hypothetical protein